MKKFRNIALIILLILAVLIISLCTIYNINIKAVDKNDSTKIEVVIPSGTSKKNVGKILEEKDLIRSSTFFEIYIKLFNVKDIKDRVAQIKKQVEDSTSEYDKEKLKERLAKISGGVAVINIGAVTEVEMKEKKHRVEDALSATRAALEEGIVAGGGLALIQASECLEKADTNDLSDDAKVGFKIVKRALEEPIRQIAENAGLDGAVIADKAKHEKKGVGFDAAKMEWKDMIAAGIIDPAKVTRSALQNAASVASLLLTTECAITDLPEKNPPAPPAPGMGDMGGMY